MDVAYDHITEEFLDDVDRPPASSSSADANPAPQASLNDEFQDAYRAFSNSPWGARIGGFFGSVVKQVRSWLALPLFSHFGLSSNS